MSRDEVRVDSFVGETQAERSRSTLSQPLHCEIRQDVGDVSGHPLRFPVDVQHRVAVSTLAGKRDPVIETGLRTLLSAHMPLADERRPVAVPPQYAWKCPGVCRKRCNVVPDGVAMGVLPRQKNGATGRAKSCGDKGVLEEGAIACQTIQPGSVQEGMAGAAQRIVTLVVCQDKDKVRRAVACACRKTKQGKCSDYPCPLKEAAAR